MRPIDRQLIEACQKGDALTVDQLLQQGANPNTQDDHWPNPTALLIAAENGHLKIITALIQYGANPHIQDDWSQTALHCAVEKQHHDIAQYLLTELQLNPNIQDRWRRKPLQIAILNGDIKMLQLLIQHGASPYATDQDGQNALHYAAECNQYETAEYLLTELKLDPNKKDQRGRTPLMLASAKGDINILQLLAQHGANPHTTDHEGQTALHYAVKKKYRDIARCLITQLQLDPNTQDKDGITPLMIATENGDIHMLKRLIQHGADSYATDQDGRTALHYAVKKQYHDIAQYLLTQVQLDPNSQDHEGITPFLIATQNGDIKMLRLLIQHGANPYLTDHQGRNALHHAVKKHCRDAVEYLMTHLKLNPNAQDHDGYTPLLIAVEYWDERIANTLTQHGANPHIPNHQGKTSAAIARRNRIRLPKPQPSPITL